jgi:hypothetical protein
LFFPTAFEQGHLSLMSSPARSTVSAASGGAGEVADVADSIDALYRKDEAMAGKNPSFASLLQTLALRCLKQLTHCARRAQVGGDGGAAEGGSVARRRQLDVRSPALPHQPRLQGRYEQNTSKLALSPQIKIRRSTNLDSSDVHVLLKLSVTRSLFSSQKKTRSLFLL